MGSHVMLARRAVETDEPMMVQIQELIRGAKDAMSLAQVTSVKELSGQICQICGDEVEITVDGEPFVACNECAFPVCKTRFKRIKGIPTVEGDDEEEECDDLDHEFDFGLDEYRDQQQIAEAVLAGRLNTGRGTQANDFGVSTPSEVDPSSCNPSLSSPRIHAFNQPSIIQWYF